MMSDSRHDFNESTRILTCAACRNEFSTVLGSVQSKQFFWVACDDCAEKFSEEDLELMVNMFIAYGGYFGEFKSSNFSLKEFLTELTNDLKIKRANASLNALNVLLLHKCLLHGITPKQFIYEIKKLLH